MAPELTTNLGILASMRSNGPLATIHALSNPTVEVDAGVLRRVLLYLRVLTKVNSTVQLYAIALFGPLVMAAVTLFVTSEVLQQRSGGEELVLAIILGLLALMAAIGLYVLALRPTRGRVLKYVAKWSVADQLFWGLGLLVVPTVAFAVVSAILLHHGALGVDGTTTDDALPWRTLETFVWNLADAVPVIKIPDTLNWDPKLSFTTMSGGALVLAYKLLLVVPFAQLAAIALARSFGDDEDGGDGGGEEQAVAAPAAV
jgi:hypothetical protein